jgi:hypothetical protein
VSYATPRLRQLSARGVTATLDEDLGQLADFAVKIGADWHRPLARVPWADDPPDCAAIAAAPHLARMAGDFFCAPFAASDLEPAPPHGWTANSAWTCLGHGATPHGVFAIWQLDRPVLGATVTKRWELRHDLSALLQEHRITGGTGRLSVAHHVMIDVREGATLRLSPRAWAETPDLGHPRPEAFAQTMLAYPGRTTDLARFPGAGGGTVDLTRHPLPEGHDDFVMVVDGPANASRDGLAWAAIDRPSARDRVILVKPSAILPQTMLWLSNGGRSFPPWNGHHTGVLGVEDACAYSLYGHAASTAANPLSSLGIATALQLGACIRIPHVLAAFPILDAGMFPRQLEVAVGLAREAWDN